jgi:hypothetical protein
MAPFAAPSKMASLQGKSHKPQGSVRFGGSDRLVCLRRVSRRKKYCHNGGHSLRPPPRQGLAAEGVPARGVRDRHLGPRLLGRQPVPASLCGVGLLLGAVQVLGS